MADEERGTRSVQRFGVGDVIATPDGQRAGTVIAYVGADLAFTNVRGIKVIGDPRNFQPYVLPPGSRIHDKTGKVTFRPITEADLPNNLLQCGVRRERSWVRDLVEEFAESEHQIAEFTDAVHRYAELNGMSVQTPGSGGTPMAWVVFQRAAKSYNRLSTKTTMFTRRTNDWRFFIIKEKKVTA